MELYLVRHAIAEEPDAGRWPGDRERPLTAAGIQKFREAARGLARLAPEVSAVWSSPFRRAWQTAEILHAAAGWPAPEACEALEPGRAADRALRLLAAAAGRGRAAGAGGLALVGHAPGLDEIAALALFGRGAWAPFALRKGGAACIDFEATVRAGAATLVWLATPKFLRALAE
jgi:phosphohistidine phosphatase SixA